MPVGQGGISPYLSPIVRGAVPLLYTLLYNLMAGNTISPGNIGLGGIGGTLASFANPKLAPLGSYLGGVAGSLLQGTTSLGQSLVGGLPSAGVSLLGQLIPQELQGFGSMAAPLTTSLLQLGGNALGGATGLGTNILGNAAAGWGAGGTTALGPVLGAVSSYAGPIGMIASAILNVIGDISAGNDIDRALRQLEESVIIAYMQSAPQMENLYKQLSQYVPEANRNQLWAQQMGSLPEWAQPLLQGGQGLESDYYFSLNPLMMFTSPLMQMFSDPQLTQQLVSGLFAGLQDPNNVNFSQWESLTPQQKLQIYNQMQVRSNIPGHEEDEPRPVTAEEWSRLSQSMGSQTPLDPFQILGGMYQQLYNLEQVNPNYSSMLGEKPAGSGTLRASTYVQPQQSMQTPTSSSLVEGEQLPQSMTAGGLYELLSAYSPNYVPTSNYLASMAPPQKPGEKFQLGGAQPVPQNSAFTPGALQAVYNTGLGLPDVQTYQNASAAMDQMMRALGMYDKPFVY